MTSISDQVIQDVASSVARRLSSGGPGPQPTAEHGFVLVVVSGEESTGASLLTDIGSADVIAIVESGSISSSIAAVKARVPNLKIASDSHDDTLGTRAAAVKAPAMNLALASKVAALQADTAGSRAIVRALLAGIPVEASLDPNDFRISQNAPEGVRRAVTSVESKIRELGIAIKSPGVAAGNSQYVHITSSGAYGAGRSHPSQERFTFPASVDEFVDFLERKGCSIEPGKPCVDCGACEARGF